SAAVDAGVDGVEHCTFLTADGVDVDWTTVTKLAKAGICVGVTAARMPDGAPLAPRVITARRATARMYREGVRLVCSSDAGVAPFKPHDCLPHGLGEFADFAQLSISDALAAVTSLAAESCGLGDRKGRIRPGYDADLLAVDGDPSHDLTRMTATRLVVRAGRPLSP
ncbi:MAG TPA: amidohydrolase family protein, partial [Pseudonocardiaceae bacterium]